MDADTRKVMVEAIDSLKRVDLSKATARPWHLTDRIHTHKDGPCSWCVPIFQNDAPSGDKLPAQAYASDRETAEANAALICVAVNSFDAMRSTLQDVRECLKRLPDVDGAYRVTVLQEVETALKLAEGKGE